MHVFPIVRMLIPCEAAWHAPEDEKWVLQSPWSVVRLPEGASFPFRKDEFCVYSQLSDGLGEFEISIEFRHVQEDESRRTVGWTKTTIVEFKRGPQPILLECVFQFRDAPFREPGLYEFRVAANGRLLEGEIARLRVWDRVI